MSNSQRLRLGIVGAGAIAQAYVEACGQSKHFTLRAVADCRMEAARAMADASCCAAFPSARQMMEEMELDAALVATPPATHCDVCCELLEKGVHVLCEKPLALDSLSARRMIETAVRADRLFTMASKFRYVTDVTRAKALVASGVIGELVLLDNVFAGRVDMSHRWNSNPNISGGGVLIDNGTHSLDITRYFLGELAQVQVIEGHRVQNLQVEDTVKLFARNKTDVLASVDLSWSVSKEQPYYLSIYGSAGTLLVGWKESKYRRSNDAEWTVFGKGYSKVEAFTRQIDNFGDAILGNDALVVTPADALASVQVIEAAYRSMRKGAWEPISENCVV
jgi:predicted dehydrogenase